MASAAFLVPVILAGELSLPSEGGMAQRVDVARNGANLLWSLGFQGRVRSTRDRNRHEEVRKPTESRLLPISP
jgi:hypothetical protein